MAMVCEVVVWTCQVEDEYIYVLTQKTYPASSDVFRSATIDAGRRDMACVV